MISYKVIGLMSGTSLDGVDIAFCEFNLEDKWGFRLIYSETVSYDLRWKKSLGEAHLKSALEISSIDCLYGDYLGNIVNSFVSKHSIVPDFISSHGHTVFHQPHNGFTKQIGSGAHLSAVTGLAVVCDFRSKDVALGGQGAPLVPIGDRLLFPEFDYCLNLGGIANISFEENGIRIAFDVCSCNLMLNYLSAKLGKPYDENGSSAMQGKIIPGLLEKLNANPYYLKSFPKSLGREDVEAEIIPLLNSEANIQDVLATCCKHIAIQISRIASGDKKKKMLVTGGGALNSFLIKTITDECNVEITLPPVEIIEFKEAIIFGFLGVLRMRGAVNCLKSVTGARIDNCSGAIFEKNQLR